MVEISAKSMALRKTERWCQRIVFLTVAATINSFCVCESVIDRKKFSLEKEEYVCYADGTCRAWDHPHPEIGRNMSSSSPDSYNPLDKCSVYMAPSTLGVNTNMGIYTGIELKQGQLINYPEIAIPLLFREWGKHTPGHSSDGVLWDRYIWEGSVVQLQPYDNTNIEKSKAVFVPGVGCTINSVLDMNNLISVYTSKYDNLNYRRYRDPGTGAFTPYVNAETKVATTQILPGSEIFANYGDSWIPSIPGAQVSTNQNLQVAHEFLVDDYYPFIEKHSTEMSEEMKQSLYEFVSNEFPITSQPLSTLPRFSWNEIETEIVRRKDLELPVLKKMTETNPKPDDFEDEEQFVTREFMNRQTRRDVSWLQEYGYCQDHIKPDKSTIPQAGRGAFATRDLPKGTIVGYSPLIHIGLRGRMIFAVDIPNDDGTMRKQYDLVINYSFGHSNSTVILTPYGGMVNYINHASARTQQKPNVKVRWPIKELIAHKPWYLHRTPQDLQYTIDKIGLSFEYVAIADIKEGDEVFMDYGVEWENAWNDHVATYKSLNPEYDNHYIHTSEWIETYFRTNDELKTNPYPPNFEMVCYESYTTREVIVPPTAPGTSPIGADNGDNNQPNVVDRHEWTDRLRLDDPHRRHCSVLERHTNTTSNIITYTVELIIPKEKDSSNDEVAATAAPEVEKIVVYNVPSKDAIYLVDKPYSADWHLPNVFRHEIMLPDDIIPKSWLNGPASSPFEIDEEEDYEDE